MTCKLVTMTTSKLLRHAAAAAAAVLVLGTLQGPSEPSNRVGFIGVNLGQIWAVEAAGSNGQDDEEDQSSLGGSDGEGSAGSDASQSNAKNSSIKQASENGEQVDKDEVNNMDHNANGGDSRRQSNLRGSVTNSITPLPLPGKNLIESIFGSLADVAKESGHPLNEQAKEAQLLNELLDRVFVPRLQTPPKYQGALECLNESIYRDVLSGPKKVKDNPRLLQHAYSVLRRPPAVLEVPELFVELRQATDKKAWEVRRKREINYYERRGEPIPDILQLSADEVTALDAAEPRMREEEISETELATRVIMVDGWMKEQYRLRLYYRKRIGQLKEDPQDLVDGFNPGPKFVSVSVEEVLGLSYGAVLDPEPEPVDPEVQRPNARAAEF